MGLLDFLLGGEDYDRYDREDWRSVAENRRHRAQGSSNWTSREDWNCGEYDRDGMSGFDAYEENDF